MGLVVASWNFLENVPLMKTSALIVLQIAIVLVGVGAFSFLLWEPHIEGRNAHATLFEIYCNDAFLAYAYMASIPFFVALFQAFKVVGYARQNRVLSPAAIKALRAIQYCGITIMGFVAAGEIFILVYGDKEDRPAGVFMGILITIGAIVIATMAAMCERIFKNAMEIKSRNAPTV